MKQKKELTEKLKSLLRHDVLSTRYKDIFDICYLSDKINQEKLKVCITHYIFNNKTLSVKSKKDIVSRIEKILTNETFIKNIKNHKGNWLQMELKDVIQTDLEFIKNMNV